MRSVPRCPSVHLQSVAETLPGVDPAFGSELRYLRDLARWRDVFGRYTVIGSIRVEADLLLFVESAWTMDPPDTISKPCASRPAVPQGPGQVLPLSGAGLAAVRKSRGSFPRSNGGWCWRARARSGALLFARPEPSSPSTVPYLPTPPSRRACWLRCSSVAPAGRAGASACSSWRIPAIHIVDNTAALVGALEAG